MMKYDFILGPVDTDSVSLVKRDMSPFTEQEQTDLINEINSLMPELIQYAHDGYFKKCIALKAKNYVLYDGKKIKIKGSALKASTKSEALKEYLKETIEAICYSEEIEDIHKKVIEVYNKYVQEIKNVDNIKRWSSRKTLSSTMMESERANETKVIDAIKGSNYKEGDRFFTFYKNDDSLCLAENFDGDYNRKRLFKQLYDTASIFDTVLPTKELFTNYSLVKNYKQIMGE